MDVRKYKKWFFPILLLSGFIAYLVLYFVEEQPYTGSVTEIRGVIQKTEYVHGGTATGRSFTRVYLQSGKTYRLPVGQIVGAQKGDEIILFVPEEAEIAGKNDVLAVSYQLRHKERYPAKAKKGSE